MPLTAEERRFIEQVQREHVPNKRIPEYCDACSNVGEYHAPLKDCELLHLVAIIERLTPKVFTVGERVQAINYKGERLGRGRVTASQRDNGYYMKVRLDSGPEVTVPQATSIRLVKKSE